MTALVYFHYEDPNVWFTPICSALQVMSVWNFNCSTTGSEHRTVTLPPLASCFMTRQAQFQIDKKAKRLGKIVGGKQQRTENSKMSTSLKSLKYFWVKNPAFKHQLQFSAPSSALCTVTFTYPILQKVSLKVCSGCFVFHLLDSKMAVKRQCKWIYCYITYNKK